MRSRSFLIITIGFLLFSASACGVQFEPDIDETFEFPPTPTLPMVVVAEIPLASATPIDALLGSNESSQAIAESPLFEEPDAPQDLPSATSTPTPTATQTAQPTPTATPCSTPGQIVTGQLESQIAGLMDYRVYLPPCYTGTGRTYPALYMLPGNIYTDSIWDELGLDEAAEAGISSNQLPPFLIVMVSGGSLANNTSGGPFSFEDYMIQEFIPYIESTYCASPNAEGRAIGGMSRGGYWALEIAFRQAQEFASVGGHSAALLDDNGGPEVNPQQTGLNNDLADLRIYLDIGEDDWVIYNVRLLHEDMALAGREHTWVLNEGEHEEAYWADHVTEYLDWYAQPWQDAEDIYPPCRAVSADYSP